MSANSVCPLVIGAAPVVSSGGQAISRFAHGTTVATNAMLEKKRAVVGLVQTRGFGDTLSIMRTIEAQWHLPTLGARDALVNDLGPAIATGMRH